MGQVIDITKRITNELPIVKITDELVVTVNNRKNTVLSIQAMHMEMQKKESYNNMAYMQKVLSIVLSKKDVEAIEDLELPLPEYNIVFEAIMAAVGGKDYNPDEQTP